MNPALAIFIQAVFFAAIHMNVWQGLAALLIGCLMGYVYYRTGSLKLTMLIHCTNNALTVLLTHFGGEKVKEADSLVDLLPGWEYAMLLVASLAILAIVLDRFRRIPLQDPQGNCDVIHAVDETDGQGLS